VVQAENTGADAQAAVVADSIDPAMQAAPELFSAEAWALWDGGRTLGGRWVALPAADMARRVRLVNEDTGTQTDGAMFRRDPNLAGPELAISSEAAEALGLKPGAPAAITIVALAHRSAAAAQEVAEAAEPEPSPGTGEPEADSGDVANIVPGTVERFTTAEPSEPAPAAVDAGVEKTAPPDAAPESPIPGEPEPEVAAPESPIPGDTPPAQPAPQDAEQIEPVAAAPADTPPAGAGGPADGLRYIQAGIFGEPDNAARLASRLRAAGLPADTRELTLGARHFTRVIIGPYHDIAARDDALEAVRQIGAVDPIPVRG
jgi:cell division protein FtsN